MFLDLRVSPVHFESVKTKPHIGIDKERQDIYNFVLFKSIQIYLKSDSVFILKFLMYLNKNRNFVQLPTLEKKVWNILSYVMQLTTENGKIRKKKTIT